jgi:hypothetical protein
MGMGNSLQSKKSKDLKSTHKILRIIVLASKALHDAWMAVVPQIPQ